MTYRRPMRDDHTPFTCGFKTAERISGRFDPESSLLKALNILLNEAGKRFRISFADRDWVGFKANGFERFFLITKLSDYASIKVKSFSETGEIDMIFCLP